MIRTRTPRLGVLVASILVAAGGASLASSAVAAPAPSHGTTITAVSDIPDREMYRRGFHVAYLLGKKDGPLCFRLHTTHSTNPVWVKGWNAGYERGFAMTYDKRMCPS